MQKAFGVELHSQRIGDKAYRVREGGISLPRGLYGHVEAVLGLDNRPQVEPHFRLKVNGAGTSSGTAQANATLIPGTFTAEEVAQLYGFPEKLSASGQAIGLIEFDGGFRQKDLAAYYKKRNRPVPTVIVVSVDGGTNKPTGKPDGPDGEVMLDIEVASSVAPGADIVMYFAPNTDKGFADAISAAVHDDVNKPSVISISWGNPEIRWTQQAMTAVDEACQAAAALGITITAAAGDNGSSDGYGDGKDHVDFPASSPHVLGCGGTKLVGSGTTIRSEVVWNEQSKGEGATGGGISSYFPLPTWQHSAGVPRVATGGRGVPDVAGNADPETGYTVLVDGKSFPLGGTSAVAPLWAGLIALSNAQNKATAGFVNPQLYRAAGANAFRDVTQGNNGGFQAGTGWDACTGLGSPIGTGIVKLLSKAGNPKRSKSMRKPKR